MRPVELIGRKRDGGALSPDEIAFLVDGYTRGEIPDYQMAALLMAILFAGMTPDETAALTGAMLHSGSVLDLSDLGRPVADKHSTGGVGDKTSLVIAPIAALAGLSVPMISGRALGHSGGTLDKLESIPGFRTDLSLDELRVVVAELGAGFIGQTPEIAPADRRLYALRDATGTVPSVPLIVASIMSKKLAEGLDALALDVKCGSGAFMKSEEKARELAHALCAVATSHGTNVVALVTRMDEPLGRAVGNAIEVAECIDVLRGEGPSDVRDLSLELAARMIALGGAAAGLEEARARAVSELDSGAALERFRRIVERQGGDPRTVDDPALLPLAPVERVVRAERSGFVARVDCEAIGWAVMEMGAGRAGVDGAVDPGVGLRTEVRVADEVREGEALCILYARDEGAAARAASRISRAYDIAEEAPALAPLVMGAVAEGARA